MVATSSPVNWKKRTQRVVSFSKGQCVFPWLARGRAALANDVSRFFLLEDQTFHLCRCHGYVQTDATNFNIVGQQCWELLRPCWQSSANGCNNSQQYCYLQCIVGRIQPIRLCKLYWTTCVWNSFGRTPCVMHVRDTTLRRSRTKRYVGSCWFKSLTGFKLNATTPNNMQHGVQTDPTCNIQQCWRFLANNVTSVCTITQG